MHIQDIFRQHPTTFSFEFFPPKTDEASAELFADDRQPAGAEAVVRLGHLRGRRLDPRADPRPGRPHHPRDEPDRRLAPDLRLPHPRRAGRDPRPVRRGRRRTTSWPSAATRRRTWRTTTAPRTPSGTPATWSRSSAAGQACPDPRGFGVGVAGFPEGHPTTPNRLKEMDHLKRKVDAGADYICTQLFFDNRDFYDFRERCDLAGIKVPIVAGHHADHVEGRAWSAWRSWRSGRRIPAALLAGRRPVRGRRGGGQGRRPLGDGAVPRPAAQQRPRHPLLHAEPLRRDAADLREPRHRRFARFAHYSM